VDAVRRTNGSANSSSDPSDDLAEHARMEPGAVGGATTNGATMTESQLITFWGKARAHIIVSQAAPTFLLTAVVGFLALGLATADPAVRIAAAGILLASGIFGALAQISSANEGLAVIADLRALEAPSALTRCIIAMAPWVNVVRYVTPAIFVIVYAAILASLFFSAPGMPFGR
jgi:hypothetical protein